MEGLRQWLGRVLQLPGTWTAPSHLDPLLAQCGYFLHPALDGDFIFRARYLACFVRKETPWLLSLRGELVASLEDASRMGLYVDVSATTVTIQSPRQDLLQRREVLNTSAELLPLWLVSGHYAYPLQAVCPPVSSQPGSEVLVHIPKQRVGLVKRGSHFQEVLSLKSLHSHQPGTFTVMESRDFLVVSVPGAALLQRTVVLQAAAGGGGEKGEEERERVTMGLNMTVAEGDESSNGGDYSAVMIITMAALAVILSHVLVVQGSDNTGKKSLPVADTGEEMAVSTSTRSRGFRAVARPGPDRRRIRQLPVQALELAL
ncbi:hypothetical protein H920_06977 [Fukomys damarensis]|uniref:CIROZ beta domain-containing protein n=1 Tax=Fukomys damarensis TaxID=885580 RepID=A0A091E8T6_FUKDA|nr:hypothetical protein H920_06977 [Fukomys damarensis]